MNLFPVFTLISKLINSVPLVSLIACLRSVIKVDFPYLPLWHFSMRFYLLTFGNGTIWRPTHTHTHHERICYTKSVLNTIRKRFGPFEYKTFVFQLFAAWVCNIPTVTFGMIYIFRMQMRNGRNETVGKKSDCQKHYGFWCNFLPNDLSNSPKIERTWLLSGWFLWSTTESYIRNIHFWHCVECHSKSGK